MPHARHRLNLRHSYRRARQRMLGSFEEAEDLVQETFLRAWRRRDGFQGGPLFRAWLCNIATNACIDRSRQRVRSLTSFADVPWLQPYPDDLLNQIAADGDEPEAMVVSRETIELAFLAVIQLLPPKQRAVPPLPILYRGRAMVAPLLEEGLTAPGHWRLLPTRANRMPAAASYLRPYGETEFRAFKLDVVRVEDGLVAEITTFDHTLFPRFGLPPVYREG
ncbi:sigma-70 family RNA polymerase sigma factor [Sphaerisporangium sp. NPDC051017]|uniref:sigma-70 family RNA polymerase sigma factor n=1 Tax=Sphaerisporangium sp. NPDC051017 TaxID=3154636 RepID=UPI003423C714